MSTPITFVVKEVSYSCPLTRTERYVSALHLAIWKLISNFNGPTPSPIAAVKHSSEPRNRREYQSVVKNFMEYLLLKFKALRFLLSNGKWSQQDGLSVGSISTYIVNGLKIYAVIDRIFLIFPILDCYGFKVRVVQLYRLRFRAP